MSFHVVFVHQKFYSEFMTLVFHINSMHDWHTIVNVGVYLPCTVKPNSEISAVSTVLDIQRMLSFTFVWIGIYNLHPKLVLDLALNARPPPLYVPSGASLFGMSRFFFDVPLPQMENLWPGLIPCGMITFILVPVGSVTSNVSPAFCFEGYRRENVAPNESMIIACVCLCVCVSERECVNESTYHLLHRDSTWYWEVHQPQLPPDIVSDVLNDSCFFFS